MKHPPIGIGLRRVLLIVSLLVSVPSPAAKPAAPCELTVDGTGFRLDGKPFAKLIAEYRKPVVDDEPARNGTPNFGGPKEATAPTDHILHIWEVWKVGGHPLYHHDMFQTGYGTPSCPPHGIPDPEFSPYHRQVFEFLKHRARYQPSSKP